MIDSIRGVLRAKSPTQAVVEVSGVSFAVGIPLSVYERLGSAGQTVELLTCLHMREDGIQLFGFLSADDRDLFLQLLKVTGVGPKLALAVLSRFSSAELANVVRAGDSRRLTVVRGIGAKTAERLMVELKGRVEVPAAATSTPAPLTAAAEAVRALEALGFTLTEADAAVRRALSAAPPEASAAEIIRMALKG